MVRASTRNDPDVQYADKVYSFLVTMTCGAEVVFKTPAPKKGDYLWCAYGCRQMCVVAGVAGEYAVNCRAKRCRFTVHCGSDRERAIRMAEAHVAEYRQHRVSFKQGNKLIRIIDTTDPPAGSARWHQQHPEHSQRLRDFVERATA